MYISCILIGLLCLVLGLYMDNQELKRKLKESEHARNTTSKD